jgi:SAM-dependent methyltransferase
MAHHDPFDFVQHLSWTFAHHRILTVAARTGLLGHLARKPSSTASAAATLDLEHEACGKIMRALVAMGMAETTVHGFRLTEDVQPFFHSGDDDLTPFLEHSHRMYDAWGAHLESWLRTGEWPPTQRTPETARLFGRAMRSIGRHTARRAAPYLDLGSARHALDIGGGFGHWAEVLCGHSPELEITVFDTPTTARMAQRRLAGSEHADRIRFVGGDYLEDDFGSGFDLVLIAAVLHQESADRAARLIERAAGALAPGGRLCAVDFRIDEDRCGPLLGALFAVHMRDLGDTWSESDIRSWMVDSGLVEVRRRDVGTDRWVISGRREPDGSR